MATARVCDSTSPTLTENAMLSLRSSRTLSTSAADRSTDSDISVYEISTKRRLTVRVKKWCRGIDVKNALRRLIGVPPELQRLFLHGAEIFNSSSVFDLSLLPTESILLSIQSSRQGSKDATSFSLYDPDLSLLQTRFPHSLQLLERAVTELRQGLAVGICPQLTEDGTGGTYFYRNVRRKPTGVFKPTDEEAFAPNNPRGLTGAFGQSGMRPGIPSGEATIREVAAFLMDQRKHDDDGHGFFRVPVTIRAEAAHRSFSYSNQTLKPKIGSFQMFQANMGSAGDYGPSMFSDFEVQKIAVLDMRLFNLDRNDANILVQEDYDGNLALVPIDHGFILPTKLGIDWDNWCWFSWPQLKNPIDRRVKDYIINHMNILEDASLLRSHLLMGAECIRTLRIAGHVLQKGVELGMTLFQIASFMARKEFEEPSDLEKVVSQAEQLAIGMMHNSRVRSHEVRRHSCLSVDFPRANLLGSSPGRFLDSLNLCTSVQSSHGIGSDETELSAGASNSDSECDSDSDEASTSKSAQSIHPQSSALAISRSSPQSIPTSKKGPGSSVSPVSSLKRHSLVRISSVSDFKSKSAEHQGTAQWENALSNTATDRYFWEYFDSLISMQLSRLHDSKERERKASPEMH
eukprot:TRINITY_DN937_c0_g2_i1.p1 TRINITY_DN937_c0_g2~~TRINITY_DN937_c0_g2_i1.p1  ORF type:complete len:631 (-),score=98.72 TRINITY_DN937_c0_g2_i1:664-2556(-)